MIRLTYEPPKATFAHIDNPSPLKGITMELIDDVTWDEAIEQFQNFLRGAGYIIEYDLCPECKMSNNQHKMDCQWERK